MVVENVSVISKEDAYQSLYVTSKRNLMSKFLYAGFLFIVGAAILVYGIVSLTSSWITMGGLFAAFAIAYAIYTFILIVRAPKEIKEKNKDICEYGVTYSYRFREQGVDIQLKIGNKNSKVSYKYTDFKKVYELSDRYEIRLVEGQVLYVLKSAFQSDKMIEFFHKNLKTNKKLKIISKSKTK